MISEVIVRQRDLPVFQNRVYATQAEARLAMRGDVELVQEPDSGLVFNQLFDDTKLAYDGEYDNEQAHSATFRSHLTKTLSIVLSHLESGARGVEIGCGKAHFFEMLRTAGADFYGCDPAYTGSNPRIHKSYFTESGLAFVPEFVVLRHVLEHIQRPWDFLASLAERCSDRARIYIEVPTFDWIVSNEAFYDIFYEHVNYFTLATLTAPFGNVIDSGTAFGGQYIYAVADLKSFTRPRAFVGTRFGSIRIDARLDRMRASLDTTATRRYIWGAGAKGITASNLLLARGIPLDGLVDINPAKQGRFAAGSGLPIIAADSLPSSDVQMDIIVMNPVYFAEIRDMVPTRNINWIEAA